MALGGLGGGLSELWNQFGQLTGGAQVDQMRKGGATGYEQRGEQIDTLADQMRARAEGRESITGLQLAQALANAQAQQAAMQASARPGQQGMAARMASQQASKLGSEAAGQSALARMTEQDRARQALAALLLAARGQDVGAFQSTKDLGGTGQQLLKMGSSMLGLGATTGGDK
jgi:hypothetical protein